MKNKNKNIILCKYKKVNFSIKDEKSKNSLMSEKLKRFFSISVQMLRGKVKEFKINDQSSC